MVPDQGISQMAPNSGRAERNSRELAKRKFHARCERRRKRTVIGIRAKKALSRLWQRYDPFVVEQMREEFTYVTRCIEMSGDSSGAATDRECEAVEVRHDRKHG